MEPEVTVAFREAMADDELAQEQPADDIQDLLKHFGAAASPRLMRLRRISARMQSLEWQLARQSAPREPAKPEDDR
jgi:hypothetical protein